jgi:hypothetical protein
MAERKSQIKRIHSQMNRLSEIMKEVKRTSFVNAVFSMEHPDVTSCILEEIEYSTLEHICFEGLFYNSTYTDCIMMEMPDPTADEIYHAALQFRRFENYRKSNAFMDKCSVRTFMHYAMEDSESLRTINIQWVSFKRDLKHAYLGASSRFQICNLAREYFEDPTRFVDWPLMMVDPSSNSESHSYSQNLVFVVGQAQNVSAACFGFKNLNTFNPRKDVLSLPVCCICDQNCAAHGNLRCLEKLHTSTDIQFEVIFQVLKLWDFNTLNAIDKVKQRDFFDFSMLAFIELLEKAKYPINVLFCEPTSPHSHFVKKFDGEMQRDIHFLIVSKYECRGPCHSLNAKNLALYLSQKWFKGHDVKSFFDIIPVKRINSIEFICVEQMLLKLRNVRKFVEAALRFDMRSVKIMFGVVNCDETSLVPQQKTVQSRGTVIIEWVEAEYLDVSFVVKAEPHPQLDLFQFCEPGECEMKDFKNINFGHNDKGQVYLGKFYLKTLMKCINIFVSGTALNSITKIFLMISEQHFPQIKVVDLDTKQRKKRLGMQVYKRICDEKPFDVVVEKCIVCMKVPAKTLYCRTCYIWGLKRVYCSVDCQKANWKKHRGHCASQMMDNDWELYGALTGNLYDPVRFQKVTIGAQDFHKKYFI